MKRYSGVFALCLLEFVPIAYSQLIVNGGFEDPAISVGLRVTSLPGWTVSADVDVMPNSYWQAFSGNQSLDLCGDCAPGNFIEQAFPTVVGQRYLLSFRYGNNTDDPWASGRVSLSGAGTLLSQDLTHSGSTPQNVNYTLFQSMFIADASTTVLRFTHLGAPTFGRGLILDAVAVTPLPRLNITSSDRNIHLSWPTSAGALSLQRNPDLSSTNWVTMPDVGVLTGDEFWLSLPTSATNMFYRLVPRP